MFIFPYDSYYLFLNLQGNKSRWNYISEVSSQERNVFTFLLHMFDMTIVYECLLNHSTEFQKVYLKSHTPNEKLDSFPIYPGVPHCKVTLQFSTADVIKTDTGESPRRKSSLQGTITDDDTLPTLPAFPTWCSSSCKREVRGSRRGQVLQDSDRSCYIHGTADGEEGCLVLVISRARTRHLRNTISLKSVVPNQTTPMTLEVF